MSEAVLDAGPTKALEQMPVYGPHPMWGALQELRTDQLGVIVRASQLGSMVHLKVPLHKAVVCHDLEGVQRVLMDNHGNYLKETRGYHMLRLLLGRGLLTSDGDFWLRQRRLAQPAFHRERLANLASMMSDAAAAQLRTWEARADAGVNVDVASEMMRLTLQVVALTLLGKDVGSDAAEVGRALTTALEFVNHRIPQVLAPPLWLPTHRNREFANAAGTLNRVVNQIIAERRASGEDHKDLLGMFMSATDEDSGERMNDKQLRDEVMTMFLAGHETTAMLLSWTFHHLAQNPTWQTRLRGELHQVLGTRNPTLADLPSLPLLERVLKESLRLHPPAWIFGRCAEKEDTLAGWSIPAGTYVFVAPYVLHRNPAWWPEPEVFDPDRFLPERSAGRPKLAYLPFSMGQRKCIGDGFAMMEAQLILATLLSRFEVSQPAGLEVPPDPLITLRPQGGMVVQLRRAAVAHTAGTPASESAPHQAAAGKCPFAAAPR